MQIDIKKIWSKQESSTGKQVVKEQIPYVSDLNCFIGLIGITGAKIFQLEIESSTEIHKNYLRKFRGVEIQVIPKSKSVKEFTIILIEKELTDIFTLFIEDILEKLIPVKDVREALTLIDQRINYWKKLFARVTGEKLSPERQRGLFGELFFLHLLLSNAGNKDIILQAWHGAYSANQDFSHNRSAVEIKTTKASNPSIFISNELQLDYTTWDNLFLGLIMVNESAGHQNTIYHLICEIKDMLNYDSNMVKEFEVKLELAGIGGDMIESYNEISYSVRNYRFFEIREGFPVIIRETLNNDAVYNIKYQIDVASCKAFEAAEEDVLTNML